MKELDKSKRYNLKFLTIDEKEHFFEYLKEKCNWIDEHIISFFDKRYRGIAFDDKTNLWLMTNEDLNTNAKELFYTLENVQVDCRELSSNQIDGLINYTGNKLSPLNNKFDFVRGCVYFSFDKNTNLFGFYGIDNEQKVITYEKFIELFEPQYEVTMIVEAPTIPTLEEFKEKCDTANELLKSYEDKPIQYQIGIDAIGVAEKNMTIDECLAIARFNITKYSYRKKNQDLEDFKKVIAYANWAIKLLNKK